MVCHARGTGFEPLGVTLCHAAPSHSHVSLLTTPPMLDPPPKRTVRPLLESYTRFASSRGDGLGPGGVMSVHVSVCRSNSQVEPSTSPSPVTPPKRTRRP